MQPWLESREKANITSLSYSENSVQKMRAFNRADKILKPKKDCSKISRSVSGRAYYGINSVPDLLYYDLVTCLYTELS